MKKRMNKEKQRRSRKQHSPSRAVSLLALLCTLTVLVLAAESPGQESAKTAVPSQKTFSTANDAADALIEAAEVFDVNTLMQILGPDGENLVSSEDPVRDKNLAAAFAAKAHEKKSLAVDPKNASRVFLVVGDEEWPWPVPIVKRNGKWSFDTKAGLQ